jgi:hypothetical protein
MGNWQLARRQRSKEAKLRGSNEAKLRGIKEVKLRGSKVVRKQGGKVARNQGGKVARRKETIFDMININNNLESKKTTEIMRSKFTTHY